MCCEKETIHRTEGPGEGSSHSDCLNQTCAPGFQCSFVEDLWFFHLAKKPPHAPSARPAFTFHQARRRLSVCVENGAKLNIFSLSVSLPPCLSPRLLDAQLSPAPPFLPPPTLVWSLIAFSLLHKSPPSGPNLLFWWDAAGKVMPQ